ncbi:MAG: uncharacterized protein QOH37_1573 [Nocardioidaceae bacterium]|jgi:uncharacterized protein|nr:uncharacterized protein [Nocardioidaceae bacterium]
MSSETTAPSPSGLRESRYNVVVEREARVWVYNGVSGKVFALTPDDWAATRHFLAGGDTFPDVHLLRDLTLGRMIIEDDLDELALLERRFRSGTADRTSFGLTIVTSLGCNFDCPYCFQVKPSEVLDDETERLLLEVLDAQLPTIRRFDVTWFGGEPLLGRDRIYRLSEAFLQRCDAAEVAYTARIVTNGYLLTRDTAERLRACRVGSAQITLDGPAETHDLMRPLRSGRGTFEVILDNVVACADLLPISIRVNLDTSNSDEYVRLLDQLVDRGLSGHVSVTPGRIVAYDEGIGAPSESYRSGCYTLPQFARVEREFLAEARRRGLASADLPSPVSTPCTAVRANDLVVGARGELYRCWDSVGNHQEVVGHLRSWRDPDDRALKWLRYDPFTDEGCRSCVALPGCMGGCAHLQMTDPGDSKCSTFRLSYREQVAEYAATAEAAGAAGLRPVLLPLTPVGR